MRIIAIANQKGGVGKTTTANAMIAGISRAGFRVLGIDLDPQGNLSDSCGTNNIDYPTMYDVMKCDVKPEDAVQHLKNYDIIPANIMLAGAEQEITQTGKEHRLKETITPIMGQYDFIIIDTPPSLGLFTVNAFTCATDILIPTTAGIFAARGIQQLSNTVKNVQKYCNPNVHINGILLTRFNARINISKQIRNLTEQLAEFISVFIYQTYIRNGVIVEEAQANGQDIFDYSEKSFVAKDYESFINEFLERVKS